MAGLAVVGLTRGSWTIECAVRSHQSSTVFAAGVGYARATADGFGGQWERYAMRVNYWFVPGLVFLSRLHGRDPSETAYL